LGTSYIQLRQLANPQGRFQEQMGGIYNPAGWGAYFRQGHLFVKRVGVFKDARHPDFGCNFEVFTNPEFLELETLGPLVELQPGEVVEHVEDWWLFADVPGGENDAWIDSSAGRANGCIFRWKRLRQNLVRKSDFRRMLCA
jgi:hypothetical protein